MNIRSALSNQDGRDDPEVDRRAYENRRAWGVTLVEMHNSDLIEWRALVRTDVFPFARGKLR